MLRTLPFERPYRLAAKAVAVRARAAELASAGDNIRAMRALALSEALHHTAGGDSEGRRLALVDARWLRRASRTLAKVAA